MPEAEKVTRDLERVLSLGSIDHHGIRPYPEGLRGGWCGHCHKTYSAALRCSLSKWPHSVEPASGD